MVIEDGEDPDEKMQACYEVVKKQAMDKHGDKIRDNQDLPL
tara:strand:+ start:18127 stop:18249 length:123 start_codon:yes stop_codon:yes gene_type:complete